jgi:hypothetical protein
MRYTRIEIEGLPGRYAIAARKAGAEVIDVEMLLPDLRRTHHVRADSADDIRSMAECLAHHLAGDEARWGEYIQPLNLLKEERS